MYNEWWRCCAAVFHVHHISTSCNGAAEDPFGLIRCHFFAKNKQKYYKCSKMHAKHQLPSTWRCFLFKRDDDTLPMLLVFLKKQLSVKTAFVCCLTMALGHAAVRFLSICLLWNRACGNTAVQTWPEWPYSVNSLELVPNLYLYAFECFYSLSSRRASKTNPLKSKKLFLEYHSQRTD